MKPRLALALPFMVIGGVAGFWSRVLHDVDWLTDEAVKRLVRE